MSLRYTMTCDRCDNPTIQVRSIEGETFDEFDKRLQNVGWTAQEFGHTCPVCSGKLDQLEGLEDSATTMDEMVDGMSKATKV